MRERPLTLVCLIFMFFLYLATGVIDTSGSPYEDLEGKRQSFLGRVYQKEEILTAGEEKRILHLKTDTGIKIRCYLKQDEKMPELGSILRVSGTVKNFQKATNQGQFDAQSYNQILKLAFQLNQTEIQYQSKEYDHGKERRYQFRKKLASIFEQTLQEKHAGIMKAMLLGERDDIDPESKELYQRNGIAHILAISGLHISLLGIGFYRFLKKSGIPVLLQVLFPSLFILFYGMLTGFSVSALRAICMFFVNMLSVLFGRTYDLITAVSLAAVLILFDQPLFLYSSSFQFSFGCIYGIALLVPALTGKDKRNCHGIAAYWEQCKTAFLSGAAITCATLPVQMITFFQIPFYSIFLNLLVIPLMSILLPCGILLVCFSSLPVLAKIFQLPIFCILSFYEHLCLLVNKLPLAEVQTGRPYHIQILLYFLILFSMILLQKKISLWKRWLLMIAGGVVLLFPFRSLTELGKLKICFLDVGQGDCIYLATPGGNHYLVDGGSSTVNSVGKYRILPYLKANGVKKLDALISTHPDLDHYSGMLELLDLKENQELTVGCLLLPDIADKEEESYQKLCRAAKEAKVPIYYLSAGEQILEENADRFQMTCVHPQKDTTLKDANEYSLVLLLTFGDFSALLTGDVEGRGEEEMYQELEQIRDRGKDKRANYGLTVLKAAHHGSSTSSGEEVINFLSPYMTVISCGKNNSYGHPHKETLERLSKVGSRVYQTKNSGAITITTDGKRVKMETFVKGNEN